MEVNRHNFKNTLPIVEAAIKKSDFLVIDAEFTGLTNGRDVSIFDTPRDYYKNLLYGSTEFLVIQFGLCAFYWDEEKKHYMNDAFNFYLFPRGRPGPEKLFMCQSSSLDFLSAQGFDFNKVIRDGISYMTEPMETKLRENLTERQKSVKEKDIRAIPEEHKIFIEESCKKVRKFLDGGENDETIIDRCNAFGRMLLYQELKLRFKERVILQTIILENKNRVLQVTRAKSSHDEKDHADRKKEKEWEDLEDAVGFSKVARMISQSEKLVIGHNMLLDVLHTLNSFFQPLPDDYVAFKEFAHCMFPNILDTKYMSSLSPFKDKVNSSVLNHLLATLSEAPFSIPKVGSYEGRGYTTAEDKHHEAGFDAYITGLCFLAMHGHLADLRGEGGARADPSSPLLRPFTNKLYLAKTAHQDSPYMNLCGSDPMPSREHVFHLTFPKEWTRNDINLLFSPYGPIVCQFIDDSTALVALSRRDQAQYVLRGLSSNTRVKLLTFNQYKAKTCPKPVQKVAPPVEKLDKMMKSCIVTNLPDPITPAAVTSTSSAPSVLVKVPRVRTGSGPPVTSPPPATIRKRTSSGVFQVDDTEPPSKKSEHTRSNSEEANRPVANGRRKLSETSESSDQDKTNKKIRKKDKKKGKGKEKEEIKKENIIERLDCEAIPKCVSAFKESDCWD